ncbi:MAG: AsmA family protein, partial [Mesorhizobium sp.]
MLARIFVAIGGLILLVLVAALVVPFFVDWTGYRADFERETSRILGRKVTVEGEASARILPFPSLTFTDVRVAGERGEPALTAERFSMDAELAPFLRGELLIFDMRLDRPKGILRVSQDGGMDWAIRPDAPFQAGDVTIERLTVTEGAITIEHAASGRTHRLTEINTVISANTLAGPWRVVGSTRLDGALTDFDASTGRLDERGILRLRLRAKPQRYPVVVEADGGAQVKDGSLEYDGTFRLSAYNPQNLLRGSEGESLVPSQSSNGTPAVADYRLSGKFAFDHRRLDIPEFRFETGPTADPYTADGRANLDIGGEPRFSVIATGAQFSFDERVGEGEQKSVATIADRVSALSAFIAELPRPTIPGSVEIALPAVVVGDTTLREVRLSAEPKAGGWAVDQLAVSMPGRATLEANGFVSVVDENVEFEGDMLLAVSQPSGFAAWLSKDVDDAVRRLPAAGFQAKVMLTNMQQSFDDLELRLGNARFTGSLHSFTPTDKNPSLDLVLDGGELDVEGLAAFASLFVSDSGVSRVEGRDVDLAVTAGPVTAAGLTAGKIDTALRLKDGVLDIDRLTITDLSGANISGTGKITDFPASPAGSFDAAIVAGDLAPLAMTLGERFADNRFASGLGRRFAALPDLGADARLNIIGSIAEDGGELSQVLSLGGEVGGGRVTLAYSASGNPFAPSEVDVDFSATAEDATNLLALYGAPVLPLTGLGPGATDLKLKGSPVGGMAASMSLTGDDFSSGFEGSASLAGEAIALNGKARLETMDIEPWLTTLAMSLPGMGLGLPVKAEGDLTFDGARVSMPALAASISGIEVTGDLAATMAGDKPLLSGTLATAYLPLDLAFGAVVGDGILFSADGGWSQTPFPQRIVLPFDVDLQLDAAQVAFGAEPVAERASGQFRLDAGGLRMSDMSARVADGELKGLFELRNNDGTAVANAQMTLAGATLAKLPAGGNLGGKATVSAALNGAGKSLSAVVASLTGTGTAVGQGVTIGGFDPAALGPI